MLTRSDLYSCFPLGTSYYYDFQNWNAIAWGNIAFVYCGATLRTCFLLGIGLGAGKKVKAKAQKAIKEVRIEVPSVESITGSDTKSQKSPKTPTQASAKKKATPGRKSKTSK